MSLLLLSIWRRATLLFTLHLCSCESGLIVSEPEHSRGRRCSIVGGCCNYCTSRTEFSAAFSFVQTQALTCRFNVFKKVCTSMTANVAMYSLQNNESFIRKPFKIFRLHGNIFCLNLSLKCGRIYLSGIIIV